MKKQIKKLARFIPILFFLTFIPFVAFAQSGEVPVENAATGLSGVLVKINELLSSILPVLIAFGVVFFIWGIVQYLIYDTEEAKKKGRDKIIYGIIGLVAVVGMWGLVNLVVTTFNLKQNANMPTLITTTTATGAGSACIAPTDVQTFLGFLTCIINNSVIPFIFALAVVLFIWGAVKFFIINADEEAKRQQGKQFMIWGIIALTVMISVWGLVSILKVTFIGPGASVLPHVTPPGAASP